MGAHRTNQKRERHAMTLRPGRLPVYSAARATKKAAPAADLVFNSTR